MSVESISWSTKGLFYENSPGVTVTRPVEELTQEAIVRAPDANCGTSGLSFKLHFVKPSILGFSRDQKALVICTNIPWSIQRFLSFLSAEMAPYACSKHKILVWGTNNDKKITVQPRWLSLIRRATNVGFSHSDIFAPESYWKLYSQFLCAVWLYQMVPSCSPGIFSARPWAKIVTFS